jgi:hypothetical protein
MYKGRKKGLPPHDEDIDEVILYDEEDNTPVVQPRQPKRKIQKPKRYESPPRKVAVTVAPKKPQKKKPEVIVISSSEAEDDAPRKPQKKIEVIVVSSEDMSDGIPLPHKRPQQPKAQKNIVDIVMDDGRIIGRGREAVVWEYKGHAYKIFKDANPDRIARNIAFLKEHNPRVVPKYIDSSIDGRWIKMELLTEYKPLKRDVLQQSSEWRLELLKAIRDARAKLPSNIKFTDMGKWGNSAYKEDAKNGFKVKFYEGGRPDVYKESFETNLFVEEMARKLSIYQLAKRQGLF